MLEISSSSPGHTVLVVEDDMDLREALVTIVAAEGYEVASAREGREALQLLESGVRPDVILVDLLMPVMDGWELCDELGRREELAAIPVILMSASGGPDEPPHPRGLVRLFRKPFTFVQLLDTIGKACGEPPALLPA